MVLPGNFLRPIAKVLPVWRLKHWRYVCWAALMIPKGRGIINVKPGIRRRPAEPIPVTGVGQDLDFQLGAG